MRLTRLLLLASLIVLIGAFLGASTLVEANAPPQKFNFTPLFQSNLYRLEIDNSSIYSQVDKDGDTLVGAVTRYIPAVPVDGAKPGQKIGSFVNVVVAVCGHRGMLVIQSSMFDPAGTLIETVSDVRAIPIESPSSPAGLMYEFLCIGKTDRKGRNNWI